MVLPDPRDRRSRVVTMTDAGRHAWQVLAQPKIRAYYASVLADFSINDAAHTLHYLLKMLDNMQRVDGEQSASETRGRLETPEDDAEPRPETA